MSEDWGAAFLVGFCVAFIIGVIVLGAAVSGTRTHIENEAIERGYAEIVLVDGKRQFQWKGE